MRVLEYSPVKYSKPAQAFVFKDVSDNLDHTYRLLLDNYYALHLVLIIVFKCLYCTHVQTQLYKHTDNTEQKYKKQNKNEITFTFTIYNAPVHAMHNIRFIKYTYTYNIFIATYILFRQKVGYIKPIHFL